MGLPRKGKNSTLPSRDPRLALTAGAISSLNEAWFHTLDRCVTDSPLGEVILPLMRDCFFGGAIHAVLLMQKGHGDQLASDIAGFIMEEPSPASSSEQLPAPDEDTDWYGGSKQRRTAPHGAVKEEF